ncbi:MAG TPA: hypothetical protein GXX25_02030 [Desulfotomaculum sp.]|uniref:hypothetical protein n=1 Tax=Desulfofundulus thermobenzoicus TaxID=29376 RepID=UPI00128ECFDB|nr:hypothetical protein [Desulfofundulus thermobenzoicus]HHW42587.1 hypothetical protein [Desulfotomaculum sp.]
MKRGRSLSPCSPEPRWVADLSLAVDIVGVTAIVNLTFVLLAKVFMNDYYQKVMDFLFR